MKFHRRRFLNFLKPFWPIVVAVTVNVVSAVILLAIARYFK